MTNRSVSATALAKMAFCEVNVLRKAKMTLQDKKRISRGLREHSKFEARMTGAAASDAPGAAFTSAMQSDVAVPSSRNLFSVSNAVVSYAQRTAKTNSQELYGSTDTVTPSESGSPVSFIAVIRIAFAVLTMVGIVAAYTLDKI